MFFVWLISVLFFSCFSSYLPALVRKTRFGAKIIRYDVRATLSDVSLSQFEAPPGGYSNRLDYLSPAEQRAEQLCEEERYFSLHNNDFEEELYKGTIESENIYVYACSKSMLKIVAEENQKRLIPGYGQIGFNYDEASSPSQSNANEKTESEAKDETPDEAYVPHSRFYIPPNMELVCTFQSI